MVVVLGGYASVAVRRRRGALADPDRGRRAERPCRRGQPARRPASPRPRAVSFPGTDLPRAVVTGNPVRPEILAVDRVARPGRGPRARSGLPERPQVVVLVFGGSLGRPAHQRGGARPRRALGRPRRRRRPPRRRRPRLGRPVGADAPELPDRRPRSTSRCATRTAWTSLLRRRRPRGRAGPAAPPWPSWPSSGCPRILVPLPDRHRATTRPPTPRRWCEPGAAVLVPDAELDGDRLVRRARAPASPTRARLRRDGRRRPRRSAVPTPPTGWPTSSRSTPVAEPGTAADAVVDLTPPRPIHVVGDRRRRA